MLSHGVNDDPSDGGSVDAQGAWRTLTISDLEALARDVGLEPSASLAALLHAELDLALRVGQ